MLTLPLQNLFQHWRGHGGHGGHPKSLRIFQLNVGHHNSNPATLRACGAAIGGSLTFGAAKSSGSAASAWRDLQPENPNVQPVSNMATNDTIKPFLKHLDSGNAALKLVKPISSRTPGDLKSRMTSHTISIPGSRLGCSWTQKAPSVEPSFQTQISPLDGEG